MIDTRRALLARFDVISGTGPGCGRMRRRRSIHTADRPAPS